MVKLESFVMVFCSNWRSFIVFKRHGLRNTNKIPTIVIIAPRKIPTTIRMYWMVLSSPFRTSCMIASSLSFISFFRSLCSFFRSVCSLTIQVMVSSCLHSWPLGLCGCGVIVIMGRGRAYPLYYSLGFMLIHWKMII